MDPANTALMAARGWPRYLPPLRYGHSRLFPYRNGPEAGDDEYPETSHSPKPRGGSSTKTLPGPAKDDNHRPSAPPRAQPNAPPGSHLENPKILLVTSKP
ncbi:unnamed protein product [Parascedosporium putredinis]|uniref:Uncharacterized protein n=1 Tax=Parascedosporium putredinis TaxID=1442378 RepID=A0A9P1MF92_9PEZI|nr:unnamed protein product [Parascedosporium putredinis]CAI8003018.1 unnamed protein product [Parascedosporium putredinis]